MISLAYRPKAKDLILNSWAASKGIITLKCPLSLRSCLEQLIRVSKSSLLLCFAIWFLFALCTTLVLTHIVPYATDIGMSVTGAAGIVSTMGAVSIVSRVLTGRASDIVGRNVPGIICAVLQAGAFMLLIWSRDLWMFYLFAVAFGITWGGLGNISLAMVADFFQGPTLGLIMGTINIGYSLGASIGPALGGIIFDVTNSYTFAFTLGAASMMITASLFALVGHRSVVRPTR